MSEEKKRSSLLEACVGKGRDLSGLIEYSEDSIVSKTILDKAAGTLTLFAFDAGQGLSEHQAPYDAVVQVVDGNGVVTIDGVESIVAAGGIIIMPGNIPHSVRADERFKMLLIMIRA
jgi:quercetin dioxygenase-like cupin family protein